MSDGDIESVSGDHFVVDDTGEGVDRSRGQGGRSGRAPDGDGARVGRFDGMGEREVGEWIVEMGA